MKVRASQISKKDKGTHKEAAGTNQFQSLNIFKHVDQQLHLQCVNSVIYLFLKSLTCWLPSCFVLTSAQTKHGNWSVDEFQHLSHKGMMGIRVLFNLLEYRIILGILLSVNSQRWIPGDADKTISLNPGVLCPFLPKFLLVLCLNTFKVALSCKGVTHSHPPPHYRQREAGWREAIDCVTFPQAPSCEGSLWVRLSVEDSATCTWKDSVYKAAGPEGESCTGLQTPLLCPAVSLPLHVFLSLSLLPLPHSLSPPSVSRTRPLSHRGLLLVQAHNISAFNSLIWQFFWEMLPPLVHWWSCNRREREVRFWQKCGRLLSPFFFQVFRYEGSGWRRFLWQQHCSLYWPDGFNGAVLLWTEVLKWRALTLIWFRFGPVL